MALILIVLAACGEKSGADGRSPEVRHPREEFVIRSTALPAGLSMKATSELPPAMHALRSRLERLALAQPSLEIGGANERVDQAFGFVKDVDVDGQGNIFVLDDRLNVLREYSSDGTFYASLGRSGINDGDIVEPRAFAVSSSGDVLLGDATRRLQMYRHSDTRHHAVRSLTTNLAIEDLCVLGTYVAVHAPSLRYPEIVTLLDTVGDVVRSFGEVYRSPNRRINAELSRGKIACAPNEGLILFVSGVGLGELRAFRPNGDIVWESKLEDFVPIDISQPAGRPQSVRIGVPASGFDRLHSVIYDGRGVFVVQVAFVAAGSAHRRLGFDRLRTFAVNASDGVGAYLGDRIPAIGVLRPTFALVVDNGDAPSIRRFSLEEHAP